MSVLVGKKAPDFTAAAVMGNNQINEKFNLTEYLDGGLGVLFFYPLDFTFVCPSEILAFNSKVSEFKERGVELLGCSIDSHFSHLAWRNTPLEKGGIGTIDYPLIADVTKNIARDYGVLFNESVALRGLFLIDKEGIVKHSTINDLPLGRNVEEALRVVDALQYTETHGEVCPANWKKGEEAISATRESTGAYLANSA